MEYHILPVLLIKDLIYEDSEMTTPFKLAISTKPPVSYLCVLFFLCVVQKGTAHVRTKVLNLRHQAQYCFGIYAENP